MMSRSSRGNSLVEAHFAACLSNVPYHRRHSLLSLSERSAQECIQLPKKGFFRFVYKATNRTIQGYVLGRNQHSHAQKKQQKKSKRNKCRQRRINKNEEASRSLRPPGSSTRLQDSEAPTPINTSKKERDDDDAVAKGFPKYMTMREEG